ncbi:MAG: hypothetical protein ABIP79_12180 [Chitinophagaceae bacterium]
MKHSKDLSILSVLFLCCILLVVSCKKEINEKQHNPIVTELKSFPIKVHGHLKQTNTFSSEVVIKWLDMQNRILLQPVELNSSAEVFIPRFYSALGIALYESVVPGMPGYQSLYGQLINMPAMPSVVPGSAYHWAATANATLASLYKKFLINISAANKLAIDSLENALNAGYMVEVDALTFQRSSDYGKNVAQLIFDWSQTDGALNMYPPYVPPVGPGLWVPTPTGFSPARGVHFGDIRTNMPGVLNQNFPPAPVPYSTNSFSAFYINMREVYDARQSLIVSPALTAQVNYWRGTQGGSGYILWYNILRKVLTEQGNQAMLDKAALAYCKMGIVHKDAAIALVKAKFFYNELAPVTYIRSLLGFSTWNSFIPTPSQPTYPEIHSPQFASSAAVLSNMFGYNYSFNTNGISYLPGYSFNSFEEANQHGSISRLYSGIANRQAVNAGMWIGNKTVEYMNNHIKFLK